MSVRVFAPAKINITLEVGRPREDGLHPLQSAVMFAGVGDWIEATPAETLSLSIEGPFAAGLSAGDDNLVLRAARALDPSRGAALRLTKNLPVASGIGGGSTDAAATLKAVNTLWNLDRGESDLSHIAATLGSDVAVCVAARASWMTGVGDQISPMRAPRSHAVLVNPGAELSTAAVYKAFDDAQLGRDFAPSAQPQWTSFDQLAREAAIRGNDLASAASQILPAISELLARLSEDAAVSYANLSGSGATCFALVRSAADTIRLTEALRAEKPHWWIAPTTLGEA